MAENLKEKTAKGFAWGLINQGSMQVLNLAFGIVLARLLTPEDYGIVGVLSVFSVIATTLQQCGFTHGLVNLKDYHHKDYNSVFWFNIVVSFCIYVFLFFSAPLIVRFFNEPKLLWVSRFIFLGFFISALGTAPGAYINKHLMVKQTAVIGFVALLCSGTTGILLAFLGYSYWALAWQQIVFISVSMLGRYLVTPFRPSLQVSFEPVRKMFRFSVNIMLTNFVNLISNHLLTFIFGRMLPMAQVGSYTQANKWSGTATDTIRGAIGSIAQPVLKEVSEEKERSLRVLRKMIRVTSLISFPALFGLAMVSEEFILVTIGEKWLYSAELLALLAIGGSVAPMTSLLHNVLISRGLSKRYFNINVLMVVLQIILVLSVIPYGMKDVIAVIAAFSFLSFFVWHYSIIGLTGYTFPLLLKDILPYAFVAIVAMLATKELTLLIPGLSQLLWILLAARIIVAATIYICFLWMFRAEDLKEILTFLKKK